MNVYLDYVPAAFLSVSAVCDINNSKHAAAGWAGGQTALVAELRGVRWSTNGQAISGHQARASNHSYADFHPNTSNHAAAGWAGGQTALVRAANRFIGEVVQSRRRPLLGPSPG